MLTKDDFSLYNNKADFLKVVKEKIPKENVKDVLNAIQY